MKMKNLLSFALVAALSTGSAMAFVGEDPGTGSEGAAVGAEGATTTIYGEACVVVPLELSFIDGRNTLNFGTLERGETVDIWAAGADANPSNSIRPALFMIEGDAGQDVQIWVPETMRLELQASGENCPTYDENDADTYIDAELLTNGDTWKVRVEDMLAGFPDADQGNLYEPGESVMLSDDNAGNADGDASLESDGLGQLYVSIGGIATASETQHRGCYEGEIEVSVDYACY